MSKTYSPRSALTVRQRIEKAFANRKKNDPYVVVHNNATSDGELFGFFLSDWDSPFEEYQTYKELDYRLDNESQTPDRLSLGINFKRLSSHDHTTTNQ